MVSQMLFCTMVLYLALVQVTRSSDIVIYGNGAVPAHYYTDAEAIVLHTYRYRYIVII